MNNKKILIVEDEPSLSKALSKSLSDEGFNILIADNGEAGLATALSEHPDLILLDIILPKMDGMTMLKKLRMDEWGKDAKVIILTNLSDGEHASEALSDGVYDFLVKTDWEFEDVIKKIEEKLK